MHTLPAFQALRRAYPGARISWIAEPAGAALLANFPGIDQVMVFELKSRRGLAAKFLYLVRFRAPLAPALRPGARFSGADQVGAARFSPGRDAARLRAPQRARAAGRDLLFPPRPRFSRGAPRDPQEPAPALAAWDRRGRRGIPAARVGPFAAVGRLSSNDEGLAGGWIILNVGGGWPSKLLSAAQWLQIADGPERRPGAGDALGQ